MKLRQKLYKIGQDNKRNTTVNEFKIVKKVIKGVKDQDKFCLFNVTTGMLYDFYWCSAKTLQELEDLLNKNADFFQSKSEAKKHLKYELSAESKRIKYFKKNSKEKKGEIKKTIKLGEIISKLENLPLDAKVRFDFLDYIPDDFGSWRGAYSELALGYKRLKDGKEISVKDFLKYCKIQVGNGYTGWKGGWFEMDENSEVWVDNDGEYWGLPIRNIIFDGEFVIIKTKKEVQ